jgi:predicted alpha/beta-fold hydrolase
MDDIRVENVDIPVDENVFLKASIYYISQQQGKSPFIINCPALLEHRRSKFVQFFTDKFVSEGFYVLSYDYRGHGETAKQTRKNWFYHIADIFSDINKVVSWIIEHQRTRLLGKKIFTFGRSFGGAILLTNGFIDKRIEKIIALCTRFDYHTTTVKFSEDVIKLISPKFFIKKEPNNNKRFMLGHCRDDDQIPFENLKQIKNQLGLRDQNVLIFDEGGHSFKGHREEVFEKCLRFLKDL